MPSRIAVGFGLQRFHNTLDRLAGLEMPKAWYYGLGLVEPLKNPGEHVPVLKQLIGEWRPIVAHGVHQIVRRQGLRRRGIVRRTGAEYDHQHLRPPVVGHPARAQSAGPGVAVCGVNGNLTRLRPRLR